MKGIETTEHIDVFFATTPRDELGITALCDHGRHSLLSGLTAENARKTCELFLSSEIA